MKGIRPSRKVKKIVLTFNHPGLSPYCKFPYLKVFNWIFFCSHCMCSGTDIWHSMSVYMKRVSESPAYRFSDNVVLDTSFGKIVI